MHAKGLSLFMFGMRTERRRFIVKLADTPAEVEQALHLRYEVFKLEQGRLAELDVDSLIRALILARLAGELTIPVIASGGAGEKAHFLDVFTRGRADAALAASVFHFGEIGIPELKQYLREHRVNVRI